jgi:hypothetical protein
VGVRDDHQLDRCGGRRPPGLIADEIGVGKAAVARLRRINVAIAISIPRLTLIVTGVPRHVGFSLSPRAFDHRVANAPISRREGEPLGRMLGVYYVDRYAANPRGGVYFRTLLGRTGSGRTPCPTGSRSGQTGRGRHSATPAMAYPT